MTPSTQTIIKIDWYIRSGTAMCKPTISGNKLPKRIRIMLLNQLLSDEKLHIRVEA